MSLQARRQVLAQGRAFQSLAHELTGDTLSCMMHFFTNLDNNDGEIALYLKPTALMSSV